MYPFLELKNDTIILNEYDSFFCITSCCSEILGQFTKKHAICQMEMTVHGTTIFTDWIQSHHCDDVKRLIVESFDVTVNVTQKAIFYGLQVHLPTPGKQTVYNKICFKKGEIVIQHMEDDETTQCPSVYDNSKQRQFDAIQSSKHFLLKYLNQMQYFKKVSKTM